MTEILQLAIIGLVVVALFGVAMAIPVVMASSFFTDQKFRRNVLIGGGSVAVVVCLWAQPAGLSTLLAAIAAVVAVAGGLAYGLAKLLH